MVRNNLLLSLCGMFDVVLCQTCVIKQPQEGEKRSNEKQPDTKRKIARPKLTKCCTIISLLTFYPTLSILGQFLADNRFFKSSFVADLCAQEPQILLPKL